MESNVVQKMRTVFDFILNHRFWKDGYGRYHAKLKDYEKQMIEEAIATPLRNCDVGTADEQAQRYDKFCEVMDCVKCPVHALWHHYFEICKNRKVSCGLIWAQMPYTKAR